MSTLFFKNPSESRYAEVSDEHPLPTSVESLPPATIGAITAAKLAKGRQARTTITCTLADTDYAATNPIPGGTKYLSLYCASDFRVAVDEATAAGVGPTVAGGQGVVWAVEFGAVGGDSKVHVQSATAGAVVEVVYLT
jgi:hypothetical protein